MTALLGSVSASLAGVSVPVALLLWVVVGLLALEIWLAIEPRVLEWAGCYEPTPRQQQRLRHAPAPVRLYEDSAAWIGSGLRTIVMSTTLVDALDDTALRALMVQAAAQQRTAGLASELLVWLGNLPLLAMWSLSWSIAQLGRLIAFGVGSILLLPMLLWPTGFVDWAGRVFGAIVVGLLGAIMLSGGLAGIGLGLLLAWAIIPGLRLLLDWESRRAEAAADRAAVREGFGPPLLDALEDLAEVEPALPPGLLRVLVRSGLPLPLRIQHLSLAVDHA